MTLKLRQKKRLREFSVYQGRLTQHKIVYKLKYFLHTREKPYIGLYTTWGGVGTKGCIQVKMQNKKMKGRSSSEWYIFS